LIYGEKIIEKHCRVLPVGKLCKGKNDSMETLENMDIGLLNCLILRTLAVLSFETSITI